MLGAWAVVLREQQSGPIEQWFWLTGHMWPLLSFSFYLPSFLDRVASIPMSIVQRMRFGYVAGSVVVYVIWFGWILIAKRRP
jgi:hypothetical protein